PLVVQSPFFFALYHVLSMISRGQTVGVITNMDTVHSMEHALFFGAPISASFIHAPDVQTKIVAAVMIILMTATTFTTQRQLMVKNQPLGQANPMMQQQKILLYVFTAMFAIFGINFPIGVLIYWLTTNLWTMGQQFYVIRRNPTPGSAAAEALEKRRSEREAARVAAAPAAPPDSVDPADGGVATATDAKPLPPVRQQPKREPRAKRSGPPKKST
ncbi:MAG TPA: YidC/Oxa1 family membrane protein insertase, partial [Actinomycetes bacterium]